MFGLRDKHWGMRALVSERNKIILPQVPSQFGWSKREGHQILLIRHHNPCFFVPIQGRCWIGVEADPEGVGVRVGTNRSAEVLWLSSHRSDTFLVLLAHFSESVIRRFGSCESIRINLKEKSIGDCPTGILPVLRWKLSSGSTGKRGVDGYLELNRLRITKACIDSREGVSLLTPFRACEG